LFHIIVNSDWLMVNGTQNPTCNLQLETRNP